MTPFYENQNRYYVSVDCLILGFKNNQLYLLINKRKFEPLQGQNSLMGGFIKPEESLLETVARVVEEYTGISSVYMEQVGAYGDIERDLGERVITIAYYALVDMELFDEELCRVHNAHWTEVENVGALVFDHNLILEDTLKLIRKRASIQPIGFNLLPEKFTLPQLQSLYEAIYQTTLDKRNFRKRILEMNFLEKLDEKDKFNSKRGAFYYRFDKDKYDEMMEKGFSLSIQ